MKKRILSLLLSLVMVVSLLPVTAYASEEHECWFCGAIYYGDNVPDELYRDCCGICAPETYNDCWFESHCWECGACYQFVNTWCTDCTLCVDCMEDRPETHCSACGDCYLSKEDELCGNCYRCDTCATLCESCGFCDECAADNEDPMHCIICDACFTEVEPADHDDSSAKHCKDCCSYCDQCGDSETCQTDRTIGVYCEECGLCLECCMENRESVGYCDLYCIESSEYEEHVCGECSECWCDTEQCPDCGLCLECCAANSDCYGSTKMCVEDSDYADHFCPECGERCICEDDAFCEDCGLCLECCEAAYDDVTTGDANFTKCDDCAYACVEGGDFAAHIEEAHSGYTHSHKCVWKKAYGMNQNNHWHECAFKNCDKINNNNPHSYAAGSDVCYECGYSKGAKVYFTTQPSDARAQVSDVNDYHRDYYAPTVDGEYPIVYGPTHHWNNRVTFRAKAFGKNLTYQWYEAYGSAEGKALVNNTAGIVYSSDKYISGANTPSLTISVASEACTADLVYYCVVTDNEGNTDTSNRAKLIASHRFNVAKADTTDEGGKTIFFKDSSEDKGYCEEFVPASTGHRWYCCGDGHTSDELTRDRTAKAHNFEELGDNWGAYTAAAAAAGDYILFTKSECAECGYVKYVETHEHKMVVKSFDESAKDVAKKHQLVCIAVDGCVETGSALHSWDFVIDTYPDGTNSGVVNRLCVECGYVDSNFTWKAIEVDGAESTPKTWNTANMLINVEGGSANLTLAEPGNTIVLTPEMDGVHKLTGWTVKYYYPGETSEINKNITTLPITQQENGTWKCTIPANFFTDNDVPGGGLLWFTAVKGAECTDHSQTMLVGQKDAVCMRKGYTGDTVCKGCGKLLKSGTEIAAPSDKHEGELTVVEGTVVVADCTTRGYTGDLKCSACGGTVRGKDTGVNHHARKEVEGARPATCTEKGYSGDTKCTGCDKVLSAGHDTYPLTHKWDDGEIKSNGYIKVFTCQRENCGATRVLRTIPELEPGTKTITSLDFSMTGYVSGGLTTSLKVTADEASAAMLATAAPVVFAKNPVKNGKINIMDRSNRPLNGADDIFKPGKTYYLVVAVNPAEDYKFHDDMTADYVTLNGKQTAKLFGNVQIVASGIGGNAPNPVPMTVAVFTLQALPATITFNPGEGSGTMDSVSTKSKTYILPGCDFTAPEGKEFKCWQVKDTEKLVGEIINVNGDVTVTALWKDKVVTPDEKPNPTPNPDKPSGGSGSKPSGTTATTTGTAKSADTGDAGIALYAALSLMSMTGGAWLVGKKRRTR